jgi:hypothetical protein
MYWRKFLQTVPATACSGLYCHPLPPYSYAAGPVHRIWTKGIWHSVRGHENYRISFLSINFTRISYSSCAMIHPVYQSLSYTLATYFQEQNWLVSYAHHQLNLCHLFRCPYLLYLMTPNISEVLMGSNLWWLCVLGTVFAKCSPSVSLTTCALVFFYVM